MDDYLTRFWSDLAGRLTGPFSLRLILQPAMATLYALKDGIKDAKEGKPAYFWSVLSHQSERYQLLSEGWHAVLRIILLGIVMDIAYQVIVFRRIHPLELVVVVLALAFLPYVLLRGPVNRIARHWVHSRQSAATP